MSDLSYKFNWHDESRGDFWSWIVVMMVSRDRETGDKQFEHISDITNKFTECEITMQLNGIDVDAKALLERLRDNMEHEATKEAQRIVRSLPHFNEIEEVLSDAQHAIQRDLLGSLQRIGIAYIDSEFL